MNKSAEGAIAQIKKNHYPDAVRNYSGDTLLVGINYDKTHLRENENTLVKIERLQ